MDRDVAWTIIRKTFQVSGELQQLMRELKETCSASDYHIYAKAIGATIDRMNVELLDRTLSRYPDLTQKIENDLTRFGRLS